MHSIKTFSINDIIATENIPGSWFVTFVNHPINNRSEIFCFGFTPIGSISGPIFDLELESYLQDSSLISIEFCDILLAGEDSNNISTIGIDTHILIDYPDLTILPNSVITYNNIDILYNLMNDQFISGIQYDIIFEDELDLLNVIQSNHLNNYLGSWTLLDENTIRYIYFNQNFNNEFLSNGLLLSSSYLFSNNLDSFDFNVNNVMVTDQNYELLPVKFENFNFDNELSTNGDLNGDSSVDIFDIIIIIEYIMEFSSLGEAQKLIADYNDDFYITIEDIVLIVNNILYE